LPDVGVLEVVTLKEQRQVATPRERIGEAVTVVQGCNVPARAELPPAAPRDLGLALLECGSAPIEFSIRATTLFLQIS